jgi:uncharacterized protein
LHGINNRELLDWSLKKNGCLAAARQLQKEGPLPVHRFFHARHHGHHSGSGQQRRIRLREPPLVFRERPELAGGEAAHRLDMGVFIISPNDKGGKLTSRRKDVALCAPLTPMQFNDLYCLNRAGGPHLSCGAARPTDFDEHVARWILRPHSGDHCAD